MNDTRLPRGGAKPSRVMSGRQVTGEIGPGGHDRAAGALIGMAFGDALGAGYEFEKTVTANPRLKGGGLGWAPGQWTDDTQMAICIAEVAATGTLDPAPVGDRFLQWYGEGPTDVGRQTRAVLSGAASGAALGDKAAAYFSENPHGAAGNGSLMRTAPVALAHLGDDAAIAEAARAISYLTHADPVAGDACVLWCVAIDRAIRHQRLDGVWDGLDLLGPSARDRWAAWLREAQDGPPGRFAPNYYVVPALQAAYSAVVNTEIPADLTCRHLTRALKAAVSIGEDTDTVAAIAGALLGARWGSSAVPTRARAMLHGWPGYRVRDLVRLAILTLNGGRADQIGWPSASRLIPGYVERGEADGKAAPLTREPQVVVGDVAALEDAAAECDVVVSLCRIGTEDVSDPADCHEVMLMDHPDLQDNPNLDFVLLDLACAIAAWVDEKKTVFIHCVGANSRTPAVAAAFLAQRHGLSGAEALAEVKRDLPGRWHNESFSEALQRMWPEAGPRRTRADIDDVDVI